MDRQISEEDLRNMSPEELQEYQKKNCIFCHIIDGKVPSKKVYEDDKVVALLDINPASGGHVLLMPKHHFVVMPQIPDDIISHMFRVSKAVSQALLRALLADGTNIFIANGFAAGQKAQHVIMHIIPRSQDDGLDFELPAHSISREILKRLRLALRERLSALLGAEFKKKAEGKPTESKEESKQEGFKEETAGEQGNREEKREEKVKTAKPDLDSISALFTGHGQELEEQREEDAEDNDLEYEEDDSIEKDSEDREQPTTESRYVASKKSTKYHTLNCPFAKRIPEENRVYFESKKYAEKTKERCQCIG